MKKEKKKRTWRETEGEEDPVVGLREREEEEEEGERAEWP
jgi:hypothetical protein